MAASATVRVDPGGAGVAALHQPGGDDRRGDGRRVGIAPPFAPGLEEAQLGAVRVGSVLGLGGGLIAFDPLAVLVQQVGDCCRRGAARGGQLMSYR
jgi:hypothetical protein